MNADDFRRILTAFADTPADMDLAKGTLLVQVRDEIIDARVAMRQGDLVVTENDETVSASQWLINRVAKLPLLADRILAHVPVERTFVSPNGRLLDQIDQSPNDAELEIEDAPSAALDILHRRPVGAASVLYLTSDAGEGKTTLISHLARLQAERYKQKASDWLLVPVSLGGRTFMRFDDVVIGALMNRLRFNLLFYEAFVELVRLGVVVPALDGFEEMFVEGSSGDAMSALGNLMQAMKSSGAVLIAARKAYFEFKDLQSQTRLYDSLGGQAVTFSRLALNRWDKERFLCYARKRAIDRPEEIFDEVAARLQPDHPLLTRAVLVKRLLDVASDDADRQVLLQKITSDPSDYFRQFIGSIIHREAQEKWIDKSGEPAQPLLTEEEHYELLSAIAIEMWSSCTEHLPGDVFGFVAELFAESRRKDKVLCHQIVERVKQHALIVGAGNGRFAFDHPEFYHFFLGEAIGQLIAQESTTQLRNAFRQALLPSLAIETAARYVFRSGQEVDSLLGVVQAVFLGEPRASLVKENLSGILIFFLNVSGMQDVELEECTFPGDALKGRHFSNLQFTNCYFQRSSLDRTVMQSCKFVDCQFEGLDIHDTTIFDDVHFEDCDIHTATPRGSDTSVFSPVAIAASLSNAGVTVMAKPEAIPASSEQTVEVDEELKIIERLLRAFMRSPAGLNENTITQRLGVNASKFFKDVLPTLIEANVLEEVDYRGNGHQSRYRIKGRLENLTTAMEDCMGSFPEFLRMSSAT